MKMTSQGQRLFQRDVATRLAAREMSASELGKHAKVHQSQVSRIMSGKFKNVSSNVMQICIILGLRVDDYVSSTASSDADRARVLQAALSAWDGSAEDARALSALLIELSSFRR